jgi:hypothetical protein
MFVVPALKKRATMSRLMLPLLLPVAIAIAVIGHVACLVPCYLALLLVQYLLFAFKNSRSLAPWPR